MNTGYGTAQTVVTGGYPGSAASTGNVPVERTRLELFEERAGKHVQSLRDITERIGQALERLRGPQPPMANSLNGPRATAANRLGSLEGLLDEAESIGAALHGYAQDIQRIA